jgi:hypothetical protein
MVLYVSCCMVRCGVVWCGVIYIIINIYNLYVYVGCHLLQQCPLKDAIEVGALLIQSAGVSEDLEVLQTADTVVQDKGCAFGIRKLVEGVKEWKDRYDKKLLLQCMDRPYETMIRREDGSIDTDLDLELYSSTSDRNDILLKMNKQLQRDKSEIQNLLSEELQLLRGMLKTKDRDLDAALHGNTQLNAELDLLKATTAPLDSYKSIREALNDAVQFISSLAMSNPSAAGQATLPASSSGHVSRLKSQVLGAENPPAGAINVYGNPGLLWRKIQKNKRLEKAARVQQGHRDPVPNLTVTPPGKPSPATIAPALSSDQKLIHELSAVCNDLAEKVLFSAEPSAMSQFPKSCSLLQGPEGFDESEAFNESTVSNVEISPSLLEFSVNLNKNVNHHVEEIKRLKQKKAALLGDSSSVDPSVQAERYYAAQNVFSSYNSDNISKWAEAFPHGSGADSTQALVHAGGGSSALPLRNTIRQPSGSSSQNEFPIIDRRQLVSSEADVSGNLLKPKTPFLASYRTIVKESDVPLLSKKVLK